MNFNNLVQQAQLMQRKVTKAKKEYDEKEFEIECQSHFITGKMTGDLRIREINIDPSLMNSESKEDLEDILIATINQMTQKISKEREDTIDKLTNGVDVSAFL